MKHAAASPPVRSRLHRHSVLRLLSSASEDWRDRILRRRTQGRQSLQAPGISAWQPGWAPPSVCGLRPSGRLLEARAPCQPRCASGTGLGHPDGTSPHEAGPLQVHGHSPNSTTVPKTPSRAKAAEHTHTPPRTAKSAGGAHPAPVFYNQQRQVKVGAPPEVVQRAVCSLLKAAGAWSAGPAHVPRQAPAQGGRGQPGEPAPGGRQPQGARPLSQSCQSPPSLAWWLAASTLLRAVRSVPEPSAALGVGPAEGQGNVASA